MKFIVTGCPRSATGYMSLLLRALRIPCSHEVAFTPETTILDVARWYRDPNTVAESSWLAWTAIHAMPGPVKMIHIQRNPWLVIDSLAHRNDMLPAAADLARNRKPLREAIQLYAPEVFELEGDVDRAAQLLLTWTDLIDRCDPYDAYTQRVELLDLESTQLLLDWLEVRRTDKEVQAALAEVPHNVNGGNRIEYGLEITNPTIRKTLEECMPPGTPMKIGRAISRDTQRSRDVLAPMMKPELLSAIDELAVSTGYANTVGVTNYAN